MTVDAVEQQEKAIPLVGDYQDHSVDVKIDTGGNAMFSDSWFRRMPFWV